MFGVDANIVALSGIAIAIVTMVNGVILSENIIKHIDEAPPGKTHYYGLQWCFGSIISNTSPVSTIVSFIPVFTMQAAEEAIWSFSIYQNIAY